MKNPISIKWFILACFITANTSLQAGQSSNASKDKATNATLISQFIPVSIQIDGQAEQAWQNATPSAIEKNKAGTQNNITGNIRSVWDGALLYLLIDVRDDAIATSAEKQTDRDGVEICVDFYNDKFPKYEEDDWLIYLSADGELSGSGDYKSRLQNYVTALRTDHEEQVIGYTVELAIELGGIPAENGASLGMECSIHDTEAEENPEVNRIFWSSTDYSGLDDNSKWGNVLFAGYDGKTPKKLSTYLLRTTIQKAEALSRGIWASETELDTALAKAKLAFQSKEQTVIDQAASDLDRALKALRRKGKYPDPFDLPEISVLPDPFTFFSGEKVKTRRDWEARREEIKDLAQYYEYGYMPQPPDSLTVSMNDANLSISVHDGGKTGTFNAVLYVPSQTQCGKAGPYPVIVTIDFWASGPNSVYLDAGYATLNIIYSSVGSDNNEHKGAFYELYPYDVTTGHDAGTLLAWAWGARERAEASMPLNGFQKIIRIMRKRSTWTKLLSPGFPVAAKPLFWPVFSTTVSAWSVPVLRAAAVQQFIDTPLMETPPTPTRLWVIFTPGAHPRVAR